jgi:CelD/BcsL family acetyltransferase involved in cellulose biosynthesis
MNVVAMHAVTPDRRAFPTVDSRIARIDLFDDIAAAEPHWRTLEHSHNLATPYQGYDFLKQWQHHMGAAAGVTPFIVTAFNAAGTPLFLCPLGVRNFFGMKVAEFLGGKHANFNMPLWRADAAATIDDDDLRAVFHRIAAHADVVKLVNQPLTWAGTTNPFALLPQQPSATFGFSGQLVPDFDALFRACTNAAARKKMRKKERMLASFGEVRFERASGGQDVRRVLDVFFKQKRARMRELGMPDVFSAPDARRFIEAAATEPVAGRGPPIELYSLSVDDIVVATIGGMVGGGRFCAMFNSIAPGRYATESPGQQLIVNLVRTCCERGLNTFDLGIGEARYKTMFCGDVEPLFDCYLPLKASGRPLAAAFAMAASLKRTIKQQPALWSLVNAARRSMARLSPRA